MFTAFCMQVFLYKEQETAHCVQMFLCKITSSVVCNTLSYTEATFLLLEDSSVAYSIVRISLKRSF